jgi:hypothetical protein
MIQKTQHGTLSFRNESNLNIYLGQTGYIDMTQKRETSNKQTVTEEHPDETSMQNNVTYRKKKHLNQMHTSCS